jgi:hypothetical protein
MLLEERPELLTALVAAHFRSAPQRDVACDPEHANDCLIDERGDQAYGDIARLTGAIREKRLELGRLARKGELEVHFGALEFAEPHVPSEVRATKPTADERSRHVIAGDNYAVPVVQRYGIVAERKQRREALERVDQFAKRIRIIRHADPTFINQNLPIGIGFPAVRRAAGRLGPRRRRGAPGRPVLLAAARFSLIVLAAILLAGCSGGASEPASMRKTHNARSPIDLSTATHTKAGSAPSLSRRLNL